MPIKLTRGTRGDEVRAEGTREAAERNQGYIHTGVMEQDARRSKAQFSREERT